MSLLTPIPGTPRWPEEMNGIEATSRLSAATGAPIANDSRSAKEKRR